MHNPLDPDTHRARSLYQRLEGKNAAEVLVDRIAETFNLALIFARTYLALLCHVHFW